MDSHYAECTFEPGIVNGKRNVRQLRPGYLISLLLSVECCSYTLHLVAFRICFTANIWPEVSQERDETLPPEAAQPGISPVPDPLSLSLS